MKPFKILTDDYFVGNFGSVEATDEVLRNCKKNFSDDDMIEGTIGDGREVDTKIRKCKTGGIPVDSINFINEGLKRTIMHVNDMRWKMDLKNEWESLIQYTRYRGEGHFYGWHQDSYRDGEYNAGVDRQLTIVYCLSYKKDYSGGEFEVRRRDKSVYSRKFDYGDFIVFPAIQLHRVKPLKSGNRTTLVGWYM